MASRRNCEVTHGRPNKRYARYLRAHGPFFSRDWLKMVAQAITINAIMIVPDLLWYAPRKDTAMSHNRLLGVVEVMNEEIAEPANFGFVVCPIAISAEAWSCQCEVYRQAFEQAQAVVRPSILEGRLAPSVN